jgi:hypothetical protein
VTLIANSPGRVYFTRFTRMPSRANAHRSRIRTSALARREAPSYIDAMEWLLAPNGTYLPLTAMHATIIDLSATCEDLVDAYEELDDAIEQSRALVSDSRRRRKMRQSGLRLIVSAPNT